MMMLQKLICTAMSPYPRVQIFGFVAAHITSTNDLLSFQRSIISATVRQSTPPDLFCTSYSTSTPDLAEKMNQFYFSMGFVSDGANRVIFLPQSCQMQQFQHYECIYKFMKDSNLGDVKALVIFGDHDDEWTEKRVYFMRNFGLTSCKKVCVFNWMINTTWGGMDCMRDPGATFEYWMTCVRFEIFAAFFDRLVDKLYLQSPYCDLAFATYLEKADPENVLDYFGRSFPTDGLYCYNGKHDRAGGSTTLQEVISKVLETNLMECYPNKLRQVKDWTGFCFPNKFLLLRSVGLAEVLSVRRLSELPDFIMLIN